jgi:hypothetical protein
MTTPEVVRRHPWFFGLMLVSITILGVTDFYGRIYVPSKPNMRVVPQEDARQPNFAIPTDQANRIITQWFPPEAPPPPPERALELKGVFKSRDRMFAAIAVVDPATGSSQILRLVEGDLVEGWRLKELDKKSVEIERDGQVRRLVMFPGRN